MALRENFEDDGAKQSHKWWRVAWLHQLHWLQKTTQKRINTDFWLLLISFGQYLEKGASAKDSFSDLWMVLIVEIKYFVLGQSADV